MTDGDSPSKPLKSAYELALERLDGQGIERPQSDKLDDGTREAIAEARRKAEARLAELEILHRRARRAERDPEEAKREEEEYRRDRRRVMDDCERAVERLRRGG